jgi:hypothetical protein
MSRVSRSLTTLVLAAVISAGVALLPITPFGVHPAWPKADGGGGGKGGGDGGGHGNGNGNGGGAASGLSSGVSASATIDPANPGKGPKGGKGSAGPKDPKGKGSTASALGALNAAHASPNALMHASANSRVGKIAAFEAAINNLNAVNAAFTASPPTATAAQQAAAQTAAAQALANAANKSITAGVVNSLDALLGLSLTAPTTAADFAAQAAALQK